MIETYTVEENTGEIEEFDHEFLDDGWEVHDWDYFWNDEPFAWPENMVSYKTDAGTINVIPSIFGQTK